MPLSTQNKKPYFEIIGETEVTDSTNIVVNITKQYKYYNLLFSGVIDATLKTTISAFLNGRQNVNDYNSNFIYQNNKDFTADILDDRLSIANEDRGIICGETIAGIEADIFINFSMSDFGIGQRMALSNCIVSNNKLTVNNFLSSGVFVANTGVDTITQIGFFLTPPNSDLTGKLTVLGAL